MFAHGSKGRLTAHDLDRFPADSLFDRIGRAVCLAGCLPRKELYEAWEMARRIRRRFRGGHIVDLAGGHGLLAQVLLLLDDTSPSALVVDTVLPPSALKLHDALRAVWPRLAGRVTFVESALNQVELQPSDLVASSHACGSLTDVVLSRAISVHARVAVLPCCQEIPARSIESFTAWMDAALTVDVRRAVRLEQSGYRVWTQTIPATITPKNRLLLAEPVP